MALMFIAFSVAMYLVVTDVNKEKRMYNLRKKKQNKVIVFVSKIFSKLNSNIALYVKEKGKSEEHANRVTVMIIIGVFGFGAFLIVVGQLFFAITLPLIALMAINHIVVDMRTSFSESIKSAMPQSVNGILRTMTKYSDLQTVLYETSKISMQPMKTILEEMGRQMVSSSSDIVINKTMNKYNNTWLYSLLFILLSYVEGSPKEEIVSNLRSLRDIVDRENKAKSGEKLERKMSVTINYVLVVLAIVGGMGNIIFNDNAIEFFFSTPFGLLAFFGALILLAATVFSNIIISRGGNE